MQLDGREILINSKIGWDIEQITKKRGLKWTFDGQPAKIQPEKLNTFSAVFAIEVGNDNLTMMSRTLGFDLFAGDRRTVKQRRSTVWHMPDASAPALATCIAINAFRLDRRLTVWSAAVDNLELLGSRPGPFASHS